MIRKIDTLIETNDLKNDTKPSNNVISSSNVSDGSSDDDDGDGGFVSGEEEFETASERQVVADPDEETRENGIDGENNGEVFVGSSEYFTPMTAVPSAGDDVEKGTGVRVLGGGYVEEVGGEGILGKLEILAEPISGENSDSKQLVEERDLGIPQDGTVEVFEGTNGDKVLEIPKLDAVVSSKIEENLVPEDVVVEETNSKDEKAEEDKKSEAVEVKGSAEDVVVEETNSKDEKTEEDKKSETVEVKGSAEVVEESTVISRDSKQISDEALEPENKELVESDCVKLTNEGDSVVEAIHVNVSEPGIAVVGEMEVNGDSGINEPKSPETGCVELLLKLQPTIVLKWHNSEPSGLRESEPEADSEAKQNVKIGCLMELKLCQPRMKMGWMVLKFKAVDFNSKVIVEAEAEVENHTDEEGDIGETDGMIFGSSEAARQFIEELEQGSGVGSHSGAESFRNQPQRIDGQIVTDSDEEVDTDEEGDGKELFDSAALAALLKAATGGGSDGGNITITSQDGSRLFSVERPAGLGSSVRGFKPATTRPNRSNLFTGSDLTTGGESDNNLSVSPDESVAAQVLYRLALAAGRQASQTFSLDAAKRTAIQLEAEGKDDLDFSVNILVLGKSGVGKSATINSIFGEEKSSIDAFERATTGATEISGVVDGVKIKVIDTPGLKSALMEQAFNRGVLSSIKKYTKKSPPDIVLYVDRLDSQTRDLNDLPLLKTITGSLGPSIWRSAIVTLTHGASAPPDGPSGSPLSYEVFVSQRSHVVQQSIGHAVGDLRMMSPSLMNPVSLAENHPLCRKNREGQKVLPNGQTWRPQLLLLCYSMKILSEASSLSKPQDPFDHRKLFGFRSRSPPLPYMLSSMLQTRAHPKLPTDQGMENFDSDVDLDDLSDSDQEEEEGKYEYDMLPPFKPLRKAQIAMLSNKQKKEYFEEYDYRLKLLRKKQWREELKRMREMKKKGKDAANEYGMGDDADQDDGSAAPVSTPLPDMALPPSFDSDNPAYRYRFLEPTSQFLARPVLDTHGWDHDCGYDGVNLEQSLAIASRFPAAVSFQITKDKKDFSIHLDSSVSAKHGEIGSSMAGFDIQTIGKQLAYIVRGETKLKNLKRNKTGAGISVTFLGENVATGLKIEVEIVEGRGCETKAQFNGLQPGRVSALDFAISSNVSDGSSDDDDGDGGFVSGEEEFETASERQVVADPDEETRENGIDGENNGEVFVGSSEYFTPMTAVPSAGDDVEKGTGVRVLGGGYVEEVGGEGILGKLEILAEPISGENSDSKQLVEERDLGIPQDGTVEVFEGTNGDKVLEIPKLDAVVSSKIEENLVPEDVVVEETNSKDEKAEEDKKSEAVEVKGSAEVVEESSVISRDSKQISDAVVSSKVEENLVPEDVVVEETNSKDEKTEEDKKSETVEVKGSAEVVEESTVISRDSKQISDEALEPENKELVESDCVKLTNEGDSVVEAIHVNVSEPGIAVVGEMEVNGDSGINEPKSPETGCGELVNGSVQIVHDVENSDDTDLDKAIETSTNHSSEVAQFRAFGMKMGWMVLKFKAVDFNSKVIVEAEAEVENHTDEEGDIGETDGMIFGSSEAARQFIEELEQGSGVGSHSGAESFRNQPQRIDGQIVTDSDEEVDTDEEGDGKELFDSAALAALLKAATGGGSDGGNITITSQDGSRLFSVERPAGLGSSVRGFKPATRPNRSNLFTGSDLTTGGESDNNLSEEEKKKLEKLQQIRVKFLRLVQRLGVSPDESVAAQVLYRLALAAGRQASQTFSLDAAKRTAIQLEAEGKDDLDFSVNILVLGKSGVGKSATINSIFGEEKSSIDAFERATTGATEISGVVDGVKIKVIDTPGLKSALMEQAFNRGTRDLNDLPLLKTITGSLGPSIWRSAIVTLTHGASAPPDGPSGSPLSYEVFVSQRSHVVQQSIGHAVGDLRMMSPSLMNPVSLAENHPLCRKKQRRTKEASSLSKPQDPFDHRKLFGFRSRSPPLPYMLSSMLQTRAHPKLPTDQGMENFDSDVDLDDLSDSDQEEEEGKYEYDMLPPFKPLRKAQIAMLSNKQKKEYFEEYDYRLKLLRRWKCGSCVNSVTDMALPPSFDSDNPAYRYRFLEPTSQFLARPVLDTHGWDHDCGYDGVNLEQSLAIASRFPAAISFQITKDKKDFSIHLDSSVSAKHGEIGSSMAGFDIQTIGKQLAYIVRGETKLKNLKRNKTGAGISVTFLGENVATGLKIEDQIAWGKQWALSGSAGTVLCQSDAAYGANFELQRRELDYPIGQVQSTFGLSLIKWRGDWALGFNTVAQFSLGHGSKVALRAGINNKLSGQITVRTSSSEHLSLALAAIIPVANAIYKKIWPAAGDNYSIY
ncbi:translocon at the outer envelope membrane of chloroplasts 159 [Actinidia rufa]|uniref:Translocon at the outer envelope membrane of chloroplasts 159 n=1 Tax=Actinidia rufa TaxID=165716 RepID=A0A7J0G1D4_9ERIC|nr:translocon at the outer envelope membrane of chloroplasts 159 [Actinidia rufa]